MADTSTPSSDGSGNGKIPAIATFSCEAGASVEILPGGSLRYSEGWNPDEPTRQILEHMCPRMMVLIQLAGVINQAVQHDAMGNLKFLIAANPNTVKEVLKAKSTIIALLDQFENLNAETPKKG